VKARSGPDESIRTVAERNALVLANAALVRWVLARVLRGRHVADEDFEDLLQAGHLGLIRAAECYDPGRGVKFSYYAQLHIRQRVDALMLTRSLIHIPRAVHGEERYRLVALLCPGALPDAWDHPAAPEAPDPCEAAELSEAVAAALRGLPPRERRAVTLRFAGPATLREVGAALGVTRERARQIVDKALAALREALGAPDVPPRRETG
jgi:RNA polymerase primary sigma factor